MDSTIMLFVAVFVAIAVVYLLLQQGFLPISKVQKDEDLSISAGYGLKYTDSTDNSFIKTESDGGVKLKACVPEGNSSECRDRIEMRPFFKGSDSGDGSQKQSKIVVNGDMLIEDPVSSETFQIRFGPDDKTKVGDTFQVWHEKDDANKLDNGVLCFGSRNVDDPSKTEKVCIGNQHLCMLQGTNKFNSTEIKENDSCISFAKFSNLVHSKYLKQEEIEKFVDKEFYHKNLDEANGDIGDTNYTTDVIDENGILEGLFVLGSNATYLSADPKIHCQDNEKDITTLIKNIKDKIDEKLSIKSQDETSEYYESEINWDDESTYPVYFPIKIINTRNTSKVNLFCNPDGNELKTKIPDTDGVYNVKLKLMKDAGSTKLYRYFTQRQTD